MADNNSSKGNPASTRMSNETLKKRRAKSWSAGERRKTARVKDNERLYALKKANKGLGQREMRRIEAGVRKAS